MAISRRGHVLAIVSMPILAAALAGCARPALQPDEPPGEPVSTPLFEDLGVHRHPITTRSTLAQRYFDQGLRLVYAFNHDEARAAFAEAARLDPSAAMAPWGIALSLGPTINTPIDPARERAAFAAIQRALALAYEPTNATARERAYIEAPAARYSPTPVDDRRGLDNDYADAMRRLSRRYPDDLDAATLFAEALMNLRPWDLWTKDGFPQPGTLEIVVTLESVLVRDPSHPGANHYYIHAVEASPHPERALPSAERLARLMPGAGHMVHMPAHIYMRLGRYADASRANERAIAADRAYIAARRPEGVYPLMYATHNLHFLSVSASMEGRSSAALGAAREIASHLSPAEVRAMPMLEGFRPTRLFVLARFGCWDEILREPAPPADERFTTGISHHARGLAFARTGRIEDASRELAELTDIAASMPDDVTIGQNPARTLVAIAAGVLAGEIAAGRDDIPSAIAQLERAVTLEDELRFSEPVDWPNPARHSLGAVLLEGARPAAAEAVYRADLARYPENGWSLIGLARSLRSQGKASEADDVERRFERAWARADVPLRASRF